ncbi:MAG: Na/Pi cotransporter family protein [Nitrospirae bacterium]|nr:Na/Pi cotransporter family protein [Nitrospirota bacterium]
MTTLMLFSLLGGIALLLYGLQLAGDGLQGLAGGRLRSILATFTKNRFLGLAAGAFITAVIQSSSATTVMLVGFTSAGLMTLSQTVALILGADIGTTLTVQLIAFQITDYALAILSLGFALFFFGKPRRIKLVGTVLFGFGLIFFSLKLLSDGMAPLRDNEIARRMLLSVHEVPIWGILISALLTALLHSSAATIGIAIASASQGLLPLASAVPIILGANVGTCATAWVASLGSTTEAKRVALAHILFKLLGVVLIYPFLLPFEATVGQTSENIVRQIANAHTLFNLGIALLFLPFTGPLARLVAWLIPEKLSLEEYSRPKYLDPLVLDSPALALGQATREALRMSDIVRDMYRETIRVFTDNNQETLEQIERKDDWVDTLNREIKLYITKLSAKSLTEEQSEREVALLALSSDLETIGDIIDRNLMELAKKKIYKGVRFSDQGLKEIVQLHDRVGQNFERVISAFASHDPELAQRVVQAKDEIKHLERELRAAHIQRLHAGLPESIETSAIHIDILTNLVRINHHVTSIAYPIIETE